MKNKKLSETYIYDSPGSSPGFRFWQDFIKWQSNIDTVLIPFNLTQPSFSILAITGWMSLNNDEVRQKMVVQESGMDKMQVSLILQRLLKNKYVDIKQFEHDKRERIVQITDDGKMILSKTIPLVEEVDLKYVPKFWLNENDE